MSAIQRELTTKELSLLRKGEKQIAKGELVWWRDIKRSDKKHIIH